MASPVLKPQLGNRHHSVPTWETVLQPVRASPTPEVPPSSPPPPPQPTRQERRTAPAPRARLRPPLSSSSSRWACPPPTPLAGLDAAGDKIRGAGRSSGYKSRGSHLRSPLPRPIDLPPRSITLDTMVLSGEDCKLLQSTWAKLAPHADDMGSDALNRMFKTFPKTKVYFSHFDLSPGSSDIRAHGHKVIKALESALKHLDNIEGTLCELGDKHAYNLRVDPVNFKLLANCFHVVMATHLQAEYNGPVYRAMDKFFYSVGDALTAHYR